MTGCPARLHAEAFLPEKSVGSGSYLVGQNIGCWAAVNRIGRSDRSFICSGMSGDCCCESATRNVSWSSQLSTLYPCAVHHVPRLPWHARDRQLARREWRDMPGCGRRHGWAVTSRWHCTQYLGTNGRIHVEWTAFRFHSADCGTFTGTLTVCVYVYFGLLEDLLVGRGVGYLRPLKNAKGY